MWNSIRAAGGLAVRLESVGAPGSCAKAMLTVLQPIAV